MRASKEYADSHGNPRTERHATAEAPVVYVTVLDVADVGHLDQLSQLLASSRLLWMGILTDEAVWALTGEGPLNSQMERILIAGHLRGVRHVVPVGPETDWRLPRLSSGVLDHRLLDNTLPASLAVLPTVEARVTSESSVIRDLAAPAPAVRASVA